MNPSTPDFHNRTATSPALFNRCVVDWFGEWSHCALSQVAREFTDRIDLEQASYEAPRTAFAMLHGVANGIPEEQIETHRTAIVAFVHFHEQVHKLSKHLMQHGVFRYVTPRDYLDFIHHYHKLFNDKRSHLEEQQLHLNTGLNKLEETEKIVGELQKSLSLKESELRSKNAQAEEKLKQMVVDQNEAEAKKKEAEKVSIHLSQQNSQIEERLKVVSEQLGRAEPALLEAQKALSAVGR